MRWHGVVRRAAALALLLALSQLALAPAADAAPGDVSLVATMPFGTWVAADGDDLLIATVEGILRMRPDGSYAVVVEVESEFGPGGIAVDEQRGAIWYHDVDGIRRILDGDVETVVPMDAYETSGHMAVAPDGALHFLDVRSVRRVDPDDGSLETVATAPEFAEVFTLAPDGRPVVASFGQIWEYDGSQFRTIAGGTPCPQLPNPCGDGGPAIDARFSNISHLAHDDDGRLFVAGAYRVRVIDLDGTVRHVAGSWTQPYLACGDFGGCGTDGPAQSLPLDPVRVAPIGDDLVVSNVGGGVLRIDDVLAAPRLPQQGYRIVAADGGVFTFGWTTFLGSTGHLQLVSPIVAGRSAGADGYWFVAADGGVFTFGDAPFFGSAAGATSSPVVDMEVRRDGEGYAVLARDGSVFTFGRPLVFDRPDYGRPSAALVITGDETARIVPERPSSLPTLNQPLVAAHATRSGNGTWYVASDGGVFTDGDAGFFGSTGNMRLNQPVLDLIPTPSERGYWLIAADGGVFTFGDAVFYGSMGGVRLNKPVVAGVAGPSVTG